ncbi:hypothetical protein ACS0TY_015098 [Phlomoides rotata]
MKLSKPLKNQSFDRSKITDRFTFITDNRARLVIPVGARFQAEVPPWTPPVSRGFRESKMLGTQIWPEKGRNSSTRNHDCDAIGRGRPETCECAFPGSIQCVRKHVSRKRFRLQIDLGPVFWIWKFDEMGEDVSKLWNLNEEREFEYILKKNAKSQGRCFVKSALESLPCMSRGSIVSYYLNVYIPRRMSVESRSSRIAMDTDDEEDDEDDDNMLCLKGSRKRLQADCFKPSRCKYVRSTYLTCRH